MIKGDVLHKTCTQKLTKKHKNMLCLTLTKKSESTTKLWFSRLLRHPARKWSGSMLG